MKIRGEAAKDEPTTLRDVNGMGGDTWAVAAIESGVKWGQTGQTKLATRGYEEEGLETSGAGLKGDGL